jgi:hypothetical protein
MQQPTGQPSWPTPQSNQFLTPAPKPRRGRARYWVAAAVIGFAVYAYAQNPSPSTSVESNANPQTTTETDSGISQGLGSQDATGDVELGRIRPPDAIGIREATVYISNHSEGTSDYYIEFAVLDAAGTNIGMTNATADNVRPGQKARTEIMVTEDGAAKVEITEVQRTASN